MPNVTGTMSLNNGAVTGQHISSAVADAIPAAKMVHVYKHGTNFATAIGGTPATREEIVMVGTGTGTILGFHAVLNDTGTSTSITFDLKKNGTTVLSSVITITHGTADKTTLDGTLSVTSYTSRDILSISMTVGSATGATGAFAWLDVSETTSPS